MESDRALVFRLLATDPSGARRGRLTLAHGAVETPAFMPVGTQGTVKGLTIDQIEATGAQILLGNTYHLSLRPTSSRIERLGGLHRFMGWNKPILTDSGGFQIFSLSDLAKINEQKALFKSHLDGSMIELSPEDSIRIQQELEAISRWCSITSSHFPRKPARSKRLAGDRFDGPSDARK